MTLDSELRKRLLALASDSVVSRACCSVDHAFKHWRERKELSEKDPDTYPPRPPPALIIDANVMMVQTNHKLAAANSTAKKQIDIQVYYDTFMALPRKCVQWGCDLVIMVFDKAVPKIKLETSKKRDTEHKKRKANQEFAASQERAAKMQKGPNGEWLPPPPDPSEVESPGYIPSSMYATTEELTFREGRLIRWETKPDGTRVVCNETRYIDPHALVGSRKLRKEFIAWLNKTIATKETRHSICRNVKYCLDFRVKQPPLCWQNGNTFAEACAGFTTGGWFEADQAMGAWAATLMQAGRDVVMWTIDGDMILICNWVVFHHRFSPTRVREHLQRFREAPSGSSETWSAFSRNLAQDKEDGGFFYAPNEAKFGREPRLLLVLSGQREKDLDESAVHEVNERHQRYGLNPLYDNSHSRTITMDMNVFCTAMLNRFYSPNHVCMLALLTANDYVEHKDIAPRLGPGRIFDAIRGTLHPSDAQAYAEASKRAHDAFWLLSRAWFPKSGLPLPSPSLQRVKMLQAIRAMKLGDRIQTISSMDTAVRSVHVMRRWRVCALPISHVSDSLTSLTAFVPPKSPVHIARDIVVDHSAMREAFAAQDDDF
jgi:hypothetical protein